MKKIAIAYVFTALMSHAAWSQEDKPGVSDLTEPRPPATVTATNVASVVSTKTEQKGMLVNETEELIVKEPTTASAVNTPVSALPPAEIYDDKLDLEQTMEVMGDQFKSLKKAETTAQMIEPLQQMILFASQAQALGPTMYDGMQVDFEMGIEQLRINLSELMSAVEADDIQEARKIIQIISENRKQSHEYFDVN